MKSKLVEDSFNVPIGFTSEMYIVMKLTPEFAELDYDAVMSSKERLRNLFQENDTWPKDSMTLEANINDLKRHEKEFDARIAFAYTVLSPNKDKCLGCIYLDPPTFDDYDCEVYFWMREDSIHLESELFSQLKNWLDNDWPFNRIIFPGRETGWTTRNKLKSTIKLS